MNWYKRYNNNNSLVELFQKGNPFEMPRIIRKVMNTYSQKKIQWHLDVARNPWINYKILRSYLRKYFKAWKETLCTDDLHKLSKRFQMQNHEGSKETRSWRRKLTCNVKELGFKNKFYRVAYGWNGLCAKTTENLLHNVSGCNQVEEEYRRRYDKFALRILK